MTKPYGTQGSGASQTPKKGGSGGRRARTIPSLKGTIERERKKVQTQKAEQRKHIRRAIKRIDRVVAECLGALIDARTDLAQALENSNAPEAPGGDIWLTAKQTCVVLGGISYQWLKEMERAGEYPRGMTLEDAPGPKTGKTARRFYRLSWATDYITKRYEEDPEGYARALLNRAIRSRAMSDVRAGERKKNKVAAEEKDKSSVMSLTGSEVF